MVCWVPASRSLEGLGSKAFLEMVDVKPTQSPSFPSALGLLVLLRFVLSLSAFHLVSLGLSAFLLQCLLRFPWSLVVVRVQLSWLLLFSEEFLSDSLQEERRQRQDKKDHQRA